MPMELEVEATFEPTPEDATPADPEVDVALDAFVADTAIEAEPEDD
jgi:hypothetical protein